MYSFKYYIFLLFRYKNSDRSIESKGDPLISGIYFHKSLDHLEIMYMCRKRNKSIFIGINLIPDTLQVSQETKNIDNESSQKNETIDHMFKCKTRYLSYKVNKKNTRNIENEYTLTYKKDDFKDNDS